MTDLYPAIMTLEFYAGLMTGALAWKTVNKVVGEAVRQRFSDATEQSSP
jgi:hypothetical protein